MISLWTIFITLYLLGGISWLAFCVIKTEGFDLSDGFVSNWIMYPVGFFFWWYWVVRRITD